MAVPAHLPPTWVGLIDDAAIFPPGDAPLHEAVAAHLARREEPYADLVGSFVVRDTDLPLLRGTPASLCVVVTGGAGQIAGPAGLCRRLGLTLAGLEIALRDPDDLAGNARRVAAAVTAARAEGSLPDEVPVHVELPPGEAAASWLAAADVVAENEFRLKFRTGGLDASQFPTAHTLAGWIDAALDRETPFKATAGLHRAVRHTNTTDFARPVDQHGFLNVLLATRRAFDGAAPAEVVDTLERRDAPALAADAGATDLAGARRWFTSFGSCSISEPLGDLITLGLLERS